LGHPKDYVERGAGVAEQTSSDNSDRGAIRAGLGPLAIAVDGELRSAAEKLLAHRDTMQPRPRKNRPLAIATFAAYEAKRQITPEASTSILWLYRLFLTATFASPLIIVAFPKELHSVVWDGVGILSTMFLLYLTYGVYTYNMLGRALSAMKQLFSDPASWGSDDVTHDSSNRNEEGGSGPEAVLAVFLLILGSIAFVISLDVVEPWTGCASDAQPFLRPFGATHPCF
jgi:hypothetical protein